MGIFAFCIFLFGELIRPWDIVPNHANRKPQVCIPKNRLRSQTVFAKQKCFDHTAAFSHTFADVSFDYAEHGDSANSI